MPSAQSSEADRMARWALVVAASALGVSLWGALAPILDARDAARTVRASGFTLVDDQGRTRGALRMGPQGPVLELVDARGSYAARLETAIRGPELRLDGPEGQLRLGLGDVVQDGAGLSLYDAEDRLRLGFAHAGGRGTNLVLTDDAGRVRAALTVDSAGPYAVLFGPDGEPVWERP